MSSVTAVAPVNIAVIKYWGKRDEQLLLPLNDSVSCTLSTEQMHAKTTVMVSPKFIKDRIWLNGNEECISNPRLQNCLEQIRRQSRDKGIGDDWKIHICSENNFPTAAGLASSAAGYACLVYALSQLYDVKVDISSIARQGSGSACRSIYGGFVRWQKGDLPDGSDSISTEIAPSSHWPLHVLILVVNDHKKKTSSTEGMQRSVETSELLKHRIEHCVPNRTEEILKAIQEKNFEKFAEITMKDSNQFHSVCLDTFPPAVYMNDVSHSIADFVHSYNRIKGKTKVAYTFDAGPNGCLFLEEEDVPELFSLIKRAFPPLPYAEGYLRGIQIPNLNLNLNFPIPTFGPGLIKYVIHTKMGDGPHLIEESLLDEEGFPRK